MDGYQVGQGHGGFLREVALLDAVAEREGRGERLGREGCAPDAVDGYVLGDVLGDGVGDAGEEALMIKVVRMGRAAW